MGDNRKVLKILMGIFVSAILISVGISFKYSYNSKSSDNNISNSLNSNKSVTEIIDNSANEISKGPGAKQEKIAYITIDDGPSKYTSQILDILDENNIKGTFFMLNNNMKKYEDEVKRMVDEGHGVGFHGVSHDVEELYKTTTSSLEEFKTCNKTLYDITGETSKLIRLPYGSKPYTPEANYNNLIDNGYLVWDWTLDTLDWKSSKDQIVSNILYYGREREEIVVLMHEKEESVKALSDTIKILKERGYTLLPITENIEPKNFWVGNTNS